MSSPATRSLKISQEWLDFEAARGRRFALSGTAEDIIQQVRELCAELDPGHKIFEDELEIEHLEASPVPVRVYRPIGTGLSDNLPLCLFSHGGGFIAEDLDSEDGFCRWIAKFTPSVVVSIDYRLGPTHKLPAMVDDVVAVYEWARNPANGLVQQDTKIFALGGSAGGALSLAMTNHSVQAESLGKENMPRIAGVVAIVPVTLHPDNVPAEYRDVHTAYQENVDVPMMGADAMRTYLDAVNADPADSSIFTALSPHHAKFPPTYIVTCGADPLRDDGRVMAMMLQKAGVKIKADHYPGLPHIFWVYQDFVGTKGFTENVMGGIKFVLGSGQ